MADTQSASYEVFLSYSHKDSETALSIVNLIHEAAPKARVFFDRQTLAPGESWLMKIAKSLDAARFVATLYTPDYWESKYCQDEFEAALIRQTDSGQSILFPIIGQRRFILCFKRSGMQIVEKGMQSD